VIPIVASIFCAILLAYLDAAGGRRVPDVDVVAVLNGEEWLFRTLLPQAAEQLSPNRGVQKLNRVQHRNLLPARSNEA